MCRKLREVRVGDQVVCGLEGIRVTPEFRDRERSDFSFMSNEVSSERRVEVSVARIARLMRETKARGARIVFVAGPVVIHTGGVTYFSELIRRGYVDVLLAGNALAAHDAELALFGTSLGVDLEAGTPVPGGHRHHMRAINAINRAGGVRPAVDSGVLTSGIMVRVRARERRVPARRQHPRRRADRGHDHRHRRGAGPLLGGAGRRGHGHHPVDACCTASASATCCPPGCRWSAWTSIPAVVTKLADRGSSQTVGLVTDVGLFLHQLVRQLS